MTTTDSPNAEAAVTSARARALTAHGVVLAGAYLALGAAVVWLALEGFDYYRLPLDERARHPLYWRLNRKEVEG